MINRIHVAMPTARDEKERTPFIPKSVLEKDANMTTPTKQERAAKQLQDALEEEEHNDEIWARGEVPGMNSKLWRERWQLANPEWKFDVIPEIIDGQTIFDFVDPDIEKMLEDLEQEENERIKEQEEEDALKSSESEIDEETMGILKKIRKKKSLLKLQQKSGVDLTSEEVIMQRITREHSTKSLDKLQDHLTDMGFTEGQVEETIDRVRARSRERSSSRVGRKRERSVSRSSSQVREEEEHLSEKKRIKRSKSRERSVSLTPKPGAGYKNVQQVEKAQKINTRLFRARGKLAKKGEADRSIPDFRPKHLNIGKRGIGKTQRR